MKLEVDHIRNISIQRQKPWSQVISKYDDNVSNNNNFQIENTYLLLDHGKNNNRIKTIDDDNNCRISHVYMDGKSTKSILEKKFGTRYMAVNTSNNGLYGIAYTKSNEILIWNQRTHIIEKYNGPNIQNMVLISKKKKHQYLKYQKYIYQMMVIVLY